MPLARIDLIEGKSVQYRRTIADVVYDKMIECLGVPEDRFQTISEHKAENFLFDADYLGIYRSENCIFIQLIFLDVATPSRRCGLRGCRDRVAGEAAGSARGRFLQPHDGSACGLLHGPGGGDLRQGCASRPS